MSEASPTSATNWLHRLVRRFRCRLGMHRWKYTSERGFRYRNCTGYCQLSQYQNDNRQWKEVPF